MSRSGRARLAAVAATVVAVVTWADPVAATWSLVGVDAETGEVGVALASCVPAEILGSPDGALVPVVLVPGSAAAVTQGQLNLAAPERLRALIASGAAPGAVIDDLTGPDFDELAETRQHALVTLDGEAAGFTGSELSGPALDRQAPGVSVQGNILASDQVVTEALAGFVEERDDGADLGSALVAGLLAGSRLGGDDRCPDQTALFAQVVVAGREDGPGDRQVLTVTVDPGDGRNPVEILASSWVAGQRGLVDAGGSSSARGGTVVRVGAALVAVAFVAGGGLLFRRGLGSVRARR